MFERMLEASLANPSQFVANAETLFTAMAKKNGRVGYDAIDWFNGGLFEEGSALPLELVEIRTALDAARANWSEINPSIMGTLFERGLDPSKRSQLGAHYTDAEKIMMIVRPVIIEPLLQEWAEARDEIEAKLNHSKIAKSASAKTKAFNEAVTVRREFLERLKNFRVLDPACGSGNFLYVALKALKDVEFRVNFEAQELGLQAEFPGVGPECVRGIEINSFAAELARVSVWIGEIQWMRERNFGVSKNPILKPLETIECRDALLNEDKTEADWPDADVIIGNPPFLGAKRMRSGGPENVGSLGDAYVNDLRAVFDGKLADFSDFVCYWFEKSRVALEKRRGYRVGLVATNSISGGTNRAVLDKIWSQHKIFEAWSDEPWVVDGADVRVAIVCFAADHSPASVKLDGVHVDKINPDLTASSINLAQSRKLLQSLERAFIGVQPSGPFQVPGSTARQWLALPSNPNGEKNNQILRPYINGADIVRRSSDTWIVDFGDTMSEAEASLFEAPFKHVLEEVRPVRFASRTEAGRKNWWLAWRPRSEMRRALESLSRILLTPRVAKHRVFVWADKSVLPDSAVVAVARDDDAMFGILHSKFHELWSLRMCTWLGVGNDPRYTPTTCFETFPFPEGMTPDIPASNYAGDLRAKAVAEAAVRLNELREAWLNPTDLVQLVPELSPGYPVRILPVDEKAAKILKDRTLTKLYNERPTWLDHAHKELDAAVAAAYGWPAELMDEQILERLFALNQERAAAQYR